MPEGRSRLACAALPFSTVAPGPLEGDHTAAGGCCNEGLQKSGSSGGGGGSAKPGGASGCGASASHRETRAGASAERGCAIGAGSAPGSSGGGCASVKPSSSGGGTGVPASGDAAPLVPAEAPPMPACPRSSHKLAAPCLEQSGKGRSSERASSNTWSGAAWVPWEKWED